MILFSSLDQDDKFDMILSELSNKNARAVLKNIILGRDTFSLIVESTGLSLQDVLLHLNKLEAIGLIVKNGSDFSAIRGRAPRRYKVTKVAILLVPSSSSEYPQNKRAIIKKSAEILKRRFLLHIFLLASSILISSIIFGEYGTARINQDSQCFSSDRKFKSDYGESDILSVFRDAPLVRFDCCTGGCHRSCRCFDLSGRQRVPKNQLTS